MNTPMPDVASDAEGALDRLVPSAGPDRHAEGNSDSHVKTMLVGTSQFVFVEEGKLVPGPLARNLLRRIRRPP